MPVDAGGWRGEMLMGGKDKGSVRILRIDEFNE